MNKRKKELNKTVRLAIKVVKDPDDNKKLLALQKQLKLIDDEYNKNLYPIKNYNPPNDFLNAYTLVAKDKEDIYPFYPYGNKGKQKVKEYSNKASKYISQIEVDTNKKDQILNFSRNLLDRQI